MWTMGGILERFPDLKLVFVETTLGWIPWYLYIIDDLATRQRYEFPAITELPSFYFRRNVHLTFIEDPWVATDARYDLGVDKMRRLPSEVFRTSIWATFVNDRSGVEQRDRLNLDHVCWSTDYPHPVSSWPNSQQIIQDQLGGLPEDERDLILCGNAARVWNL